MPGEREVFEAPLAGARVERERDEVVVVEVAVGHRHRLAAVADHRLQRAGVVLGTEQRDLAADELRVLAGPALAAQQRHLRVDLGDRVVAVDAHAVGVLGVVARRAGEVALRKDAVRPLAAGHPLAEHLVGLLDVRRQLAQRRASAAVRSGCSGRVAISSARRRVRSEGMRSEASAAVGRFGLHWRNGGALGSVFRLRPGSVPPLFGEGVRPRPRQASPRMSVLCWSRSIQPRARLAAVAPRPARARRVGRRSRAALRERRRRDGSASPW